MESSTRRNFFGSVAGLTALAATPAAKAAAPGTNDLKLGVASYSFREFSRTLAIEMTKKLDVRYINIKEMHLLYRSTPEELAKGRAQFERAGLTILGGGAVYMLKEDDSDIQFYFDYAKAAGMPLMVIGPTKATLPRIEKFAQKYDIQVAVHNHGPEDPHFPTPQSALKAMKNMDPRVGVCVDVGHTARCGLDLVETLAEAGPRLLDMHIKDLRSAQDKNSQCPVGDGSLPIVGMFQQLKKMKYQGGVMLEYEIDADNPVPNMAKSFAYMRGVLAGLHG